MLLSGCNEGPQYEDVVYVTGTENTPTTTLLLDGDNGAMGLTVTSTAKLDKDAKVTMKVAPELLPAYNEKYGMKYEMLPEGSYQFLNGDVTIKGGQAQSSQAELKITSTENFKEGVTYCAPITISSANGLNVLEPQRTAFVVVNRVLRTKVADVTGMYYNVPSFLEGNPLSEPVKNLNQLTMECKVYVNQFCDYNPFISSIMGIEERFLLRFGDVSCDPDQLQLAAGTVGGKKYPMTLNMHFATGRWYHIACVYNGTTITMYVNGKAESSTTTGGGTVDLTWDYMGGFNIGKSERGRFLRGYISEARVWSRALTTSELQSNVCYVDPTSDGLVAYWRFNGTDVDGMKVKDLTGHGHDAVATRTPKFVDNQPCPF